MSAASEDRDMMAAEFVLGTLERHDARAVELMAQSDRELAEAIAAWQDRLAPLAKLVPEKPPPREVWARLDDAIAPVVLKLPQAKPPLAARAWRSVAVWRGTTAGALAIAAALAGIAVLHTPPGPAKPLFVAELAPTPPAASAGTPEAAGSGAGPLAQTAAAEHGAFPQNFAQVAVGAATPKPEAFSHAAAGTVQAAPGSSLERTQPAQAAGEAPSQPVWILVTGSPDGTLRVKPVGPLQVPAGKELELWAQPPGAAHARPVGPLPAGGTRLSLPDIGKANTKLMVSLEPLGGTPREAPSGRVLYSGTLAPLP